MASKAAPVKRSSKKAAKPRARRLSNAKLLKLAAKHRPPQAWFDATDLPFTPTKD